MTTAHPPRRLGAPDSRTRAKLVDAAERLLLDEGYAAVTSRRVGSTAGLEPQLVHDYFQTMDDLFVEVFHRRAEENLGRFERMVAGGCSISDLWRFNADLRGARFVSTSNSLPWRTTARRSGPRSPATPSVSGRRWSTPSPTPSPASMPIGCRRWWRCW